MNKNVLIKLQSTETDVWDGEECNAYVGTETTIVPPLIDDNEGFIIHIFQCI